ncbi:hypothetical protein OG432_08180 [Streptomyces sp. NBC_00442]|uniref:hypothetical protein n=1 Tax=Streptomyces sp. NBC_00442 TaxID=2903651 RepID=UPI002E1AB0AE
MTMTRGPARSQPGADVARLAQAGIDWDAVVVSRYYALQALERLARPGSVAVDPRTAQPVLHFFVPAGTTDGWDLEQTTAFSTATYVMLPAATREAQPGAYWLLPPVGGFIQHTETAALQLALEAVGLRAGREAS